MKRKLFSLMACFLFLCLLFSPTGAAKQKTVRVGYPIQPGLTDIDENGNYTGYSYEFLEEIAQYTGWEYEFIQVNAGDPQSTQETLLQMLHDGKIDLLCSMPRSDELEQQLAYTTESYGKMYSILYTLENTDITQANYFTQDSLNVAVLTARKQSNESMVNSLNQQGLKVNLIPCRTPEEMYQSVKDGQADCFLSSDFDQVSDARPVVKFDPHPFYFAAAKDNVEIIRTLSLALNELEDAKPYFTADLYRKYFSADKNQLTLTEQEKAYIAKHPALKVAVLKDRKPIQYVDEKTGQVSGIGPDFLACVSQQTGLNFDYVVAQNYEEYAKLLTNHEVDLAVSVPYQYRHANSNNIALTHPYATAQRMLAVRENLNPNQLEDKILAIPEGVQDDYTSNMVQYANVEQCFDAVLRGEADYTYGSSYVIQYFSSMPKYRRLTVVPSGNDVFKNCIGVTRPANINLISIISKTIRSMPEENAQSIIYRNTYYHQSDISLLSFINTNPAQAMLILTVFMSVIVAILSYFLYRRGKINRQIALDNQRYIQLSELSNEYLFEYNFQKDRLTLPTKSAEFFGTARVQEHYKDTLLSRSDDPQAKVLLALLEDAHRERSGVKEYQFIMPDHTQQWMQVTFESIADKAGQYVYCIGKITNIDQQIKEKQALMTKAQEDSLTGLYNAATIRSLLTDYFAGPDAHGALFIIDIDLFKEINDHFGHYTGDQVLKKVAQILKSCFRENDLVGRLGGDEFVALMKGKVTKDVLRQKCLEIQKRIKSGVPVEDDKRITLSMGVAVAAPNSTFNQMYAAADQMLYQVKNQTRNSFAIKL